MKVYSYSILKTEENEKKVFDKIRGNLDMKKYFKANISKKRFREQFVFCDKIKRVKERRKLIFEEEKNTKVSSIWANE